ncbi:hypothetical protein BSL78_27259 [Apostichopus japonicus]|uniref:NACHT domain-containing protein n=1 Tax=Stichopus japonicus TaxID=307972 RepID=A0A2G8JJJ0_STIJA|nr:hypothetical protein BSL78_27259 [Apostichopus japonicus]
MRCTVIILFGVVGAVTPTHCPTVQQCNSCEDCIKQLERNEQTALTCFLNKEKSGLVWTDGEICDKGEKENKIWCFSPVVAAVEVISDVILIPSVFILVYVIAKRGCKIRDMEEASTPMDALTESLKQIYIPFGEYWCGESQYEVTYTDGRNKTMNTVDDLLASLPKDPKNKRVLFIGKSGIGKSRLFRTIAKKWMDGEILQDVILIYLQLEHLCTDSNILEALHASLKPDKNSITVDTLRMKLQKERCVVMLDGLSNVGRSQNTTQNNDKKNEFTVKKLFLDEKNTYKNMEIWITCRSQIDAESVIGRSLESNIKVNFHGFTNSQRDNFFSRCLPVNGNSINDIANAWQDYIKDNPNDNLDGRYSSPLIAQLFASYYSQKDTIKHFMKFTKSKWKDLEKLDNFHLSVCLLEKFFQDKDEYKEIAKTFHQKEVVFKYITDDYFQEATLHLWQVLNETDRHLKTLDVYGDFPHHLMKYSPTIDEQVVFHDIRLSVDHNDNTSLLGTIALQKCNKVKFSNRTLHADRTSQQTD